MKFIRDLYFFIHLTVFLLYVLQEVDADCEKDAKKVKEIFNEFTKKVMEDFKPRYLRSSSVKDLQDESKQKHINKSKIALEPSTSEPSKPESSTSEPSSSESLTFEPSTPESSTSEPSTYDSPTPGPSTPESSTSETFTYESPTLEPSTSRYAPINLKEELMKTYTQITEMDSRMRDQRYEDYIQNLHVKQNTFCEKVSQRCFKDVTKVIAKEDVIAFSPRFTAPTNSTDEDKNIRDYTAEYITELLSCSFIDNADKQINFFFTEHGFASNTIIVLFKSDDYKLDATDIEPFAIIRDKDLLNEIGTIRVI